MNNLLKIRTRPKVCLILFILGAVLCIVLDILGVTSITIKSVFNSPIDLPVPSWVILPLTYIILGAVTGILSKRPYDAAFYGACLGQCQTLLPIIAFYFILHTGNEFEMFWRALCGIPLSASFAGIAFYTKRLITKS